MKKEKELLLLGHLRLNARESITRISKKTGIPISTVFDKLREYDGKLIAKHTALLDFQKLGFDLKAHLLFKLNKDKREDFQRFLMNHPRVNSVFRINNGYDYLVEAVFKGLQDLDTFFEQANKHSIEERKEFFVLKDIMREGFLAYKPGFEHVMKPEISLR